LNRAHCSRLLIGLLATHASGLAADSYGVFDARGLALGGTGVALGNADTGHFYNPALTAFHEGHEDRTRDGSHSFHALLAAVSDGARTAADLIDDDLEGRLSDAIDDLNGAPTPETARVGIDAARELERAMRDIDGKDINAEGYVGYSVSLPGDFEGGTFFVGSRVLGRGVSQIAQADYDLLEDYMEALEFVESGGTRGEEHPELYNDNGLMDPSEQIQSSASGTGLLLSELGVSAGKQYTLWNQEIALGIAPKVVHLRIFDESWRVVNGTFESAGTDRTEFYFNVDIGAAVTLADHWRIGLAVKDLRSKTITTDAGERIKLQPRGRLGLAYIGESFDVGLDADLDKTPALQGEAERQDVSLGIEYRLPILALRLGYRHDLEASVGDQLSGGLGWHLGSFLLDLTYVQGDGGEGAGLRIGWAY
jgi:Protein of unknown function (DUF3308).